MKVLKIIAVILALAIAAAAVGLLLKMYLDGRKPGTPQSSGQETRTPSQETLETDHPQTETKKMDDPSTQTPPETHPSFTVELFKTIITMYATVDVNIRIQPTTESDRYGTLHKGETIKVKGITDNGWYQVVFREIYTGYIRSDYLTQDMISTGVTLSQFETPVARYATVDVNVRASYTTNSDKLGVLATGEKVMVIGVTSNGWAKIEYNGRFAYVFAEYLSTVMPSATQSPESSS